MTQWDGIIYTGPSHAVIAPERMEELLAVTDRDILLHGADSVNVMIFPLVFGRLNAPFASDRSSLGFITSDAERRRWLSELPYESPSYTNRFFRDFVIMQADLAVHETLENTRPPLVDTPVTGPMATHRRSFFVMPAIEMSLPSSTPAFGTPFCRRLRMRKSSKISKSGYKRDSDTKQPQLREFPELRLLFLNIYYALSVIPSTASSFLRILATNLSRSSEVNSSSPALKVSVNAMLFIVGGIGTPS